MPLGVARAVMTRAAATSAGVVTLEDSASGGPFSGVDPWTSFNITITADTDQVLVFTGHRGGNTGISRVVGVTVGGQAATVRQHYIELTGSDIIVTCHQLLAANLPAAGERAVSVDVGSTSIRGLAAAVALKGAEQVAPQTNGANSSAASAIGPTAITLDAGGIAFQVAFKNGTSPFTAHGAETVILSDDEPIAGDAILVTYKAQAVTGAISLQATFDTNEIVHGIYGVNPA